MVDKSRMSDTPADTVDVDEGAVDIQRSEIKRPEFFGNHQGSSSDSIFGSAAAIGSLFGGVISILKSELVESRNPTDSLFRLTIAEYAEVEKRAQSIASYGNIPLDVVTDFLLILCYINDLSDMEIIADGVQIAELSNPAIFRKPFLIVSITGLEKIAYLASAVEGLVSMFRRYLPTSQNTDNSKGEDISNILDRLSSVVGGFGSFGGATARLQLPTSTDAIGNFMSELVTGNRIPMTVIAKNPMLQSPSYVGKAFFGESPTALSNIDIKQLFNKKIGCFPKPSNGSGTTSFGIQNMKSFSSSMSVAGLANKILFGGSMPSEGTKKLRQLSAIVDQINTFTGSTADEILDIRRADTAIPMMSALSAVASGTDKSVFSTDTFSAGWKLSNSLSNHLQNANPRLMETVKRFT